MLRDRVLLGALLMGMSVLPALSNEILSDMEFPKPPAFRVGISEYPEQQYIQAEENKNTKLEKKYAKVDNSQGAEIADYTYADLDLKRMSKEISNELEYDGQDMLSDLSLLWQGAAMQSETINFALYKLANPDADKPDEKSIKKVLTTIASMSTLVGAGIGNPVIAGTSLISGNVLGIMTQDTKALNYKYTKVNDADMIILIRKVEDLQQKTVDLYYDYMSSKKQVELISDLVNERKEKFDYAQANNAPRELIVITDAYYRTAIDKLRNAKSEFFSKRAALEQFVGNETLLQFEGELVARENGQKVAGKSSEEQTEEYNQTVQNVEMFKENLSQSENNSQLTPDSLSEFNSEQQVSSVPLEQYEQNKINIAENKNVVDANKVTGLSSNLQEEKAVSKGNKKTEKVNKKAERKEKKIAEKVQKEKTEKKKINDKLIFLKHNDTEVQTEQSQEQGYAEPQSPEQEQFVAPVKQNKPRQYGSIDTSGLLPLDEIKPPQLQGGYSIHSDYVHGDYYGDNSVQF